MMYGADIFACSKSTFEMLREKVAQVYHYNIGGYEVRESPIFPYERKWLACDVATREEIHIPSGEWVHGIMYSRPAEREIEPLLMQPERPDINSIRLEMLMYRGKTFLF